MSSLCNKRIILGVTGGIAAYKSADLVRRLQTLGADVRVVMTAAAQEFITPLTMQALSGNAVHTDLLDTEAEAAMGHIALARWADAIVVAPATADFVAKLNSGEASDLLSTLCLASKAIMLLAPAMNQAMWSNPSTQDNVVALKTKGVRFIGPESGEQACGDLGYGRMSEPLMIAEAVSNVFESGVLAGKKVLITAGPTREAIDPVRYISNHSSGKMGYALAQAAIEAGAQTIVVSGPVNLDAPERAQVIKVESAVQMHQAVKENIAQVDVFIGCAAVADYRPVRVESGKIKKSAQGFKLEFVENPDIIADVATHSGIYVVGFAAETSNLERYASEKLQRKNLNMVVANDVSISGRGFGSDNNAVSIVEYDDVGEVKITTIDETSKAQLARGLVQLIAKNIHSE